MSFNQELYFFLMVSWSVLKLSILLLKLFVKTDKERSVFGVECSH